MTASLAEAKEISTDAAALAVLSERDGSLALKEEQRTELKAFFY